MYLKYRSRGRPTLVSSTSNLWFPKQLKQAIVNAFQAEIRRGDHCEANHSK
jgi:hypothetical protein